MKHFAKVIAAGVGLGVVLAVIQNGLQIEKNTFLRGYFIAGALIIAGIVLVNVLYHGRYRKEMQKAAVLLEEGKTGEYVAAVEELLRRARGKQLRNLLELNLSAGYCDLKQYDRAIALLEKLANERLSGVVKMVHRLNLCVCYFYTGQNAKAMEVYRDSQKDFAPFKKSPAYGGNLAVLEMLADMERGETEQAAALLKEARETWNYPRLQEDYRKIEARLEEME